MYDLFFVFVGGGCFLWWRCHLVCIFIDKCAFWSLFCQDVCCSFFTFSFCSPVVCFFSLLRIVVEEDCRSAVSRVPSRHHIGWVRWNGDNTSKNQVFSLLVSAVALLKGYVKFVIYKCWGIFDTILQLMSVILDHMQKRKIMEVNGKSA